MEVEEQLGERTKPRKRCVSATEQEGHAQDTQPNYGTHCKIKTRDPLFKND